MSIFDIDLAQRIAADMPLDELKFLGKLISGEYPQHECHVGGWSEKRLWEKGLLDVYTDQRRQLSINAPTMLGRAVYGLARQRWRERKAKPESRA